MIIHETTAKTNSNYKPFQTLFKKDASSEINHRRASNTILTTNSQEAIGSIVTGSFANRISKTITSGLIAPKTMDEFDRLYGAMRMDLSLKKIQGERLSQRDEVVLGIIAAWFRDLKKESVNPNFEKAEEALERIKALFE